MLKNAKMITFSLIIFSFLLIITSVTVSAGTNGHSQAQAVAWANSQIGKALDYDGAYGAQCVDFTCYYYQELGQAIPWGNANQYANGGNFCPSGWSYKSSPQPGDVAVWLGGDNGHVAIVTEIRGSQMVCVEQNYGGKMYVTANLHNIDAYTYIRPDFPSNPSASFSPWSDSKYTYVEYTDAAVGQHINVSGGTLTQYGMVLYDSNGTELARAADSTSSWSNDPGNVFFKINSECGYTLTKGTTYKYKFYAIVSGKTIWSNMQSFTTKGPVSVSASFSAWNNSNYTYVKETDASIGQKISVSGGILTQYGMVLYDSNGTELARAYDSTSNWSNNPGTVYFKINAECKYTLTPGTTYKYKFYAIISGVTKWSSIQSFTTNDTITPSVPTVIPVEISPSNSVTVDAVDKQITTAKSDADPKGSVFNLLQAKGMAKSKTSVKVSWKKVSGAKTYVIYGNKCGVNNQFKKITTVTGTSYTQKKLTKGTYYKYLIVAVNGDKVFSASKTIHVATKGGKVGNSKSITTKAKKNKVSLKKGKTFKLGAKAVAQSKKLKVKKHRAIAYECSNKKIATVSGKGVIKAVGKGTCYVFAYAQNGVCKKIKVTVQ